MERLTPLTGQDTYQQLQELLRQRDLDALLAIFAERVAKIVRIHTLHLDCGQPHSLIAHAPQARQVLHSYRFELRGQHEQLLGQLQYELEQPLSDGQRRQLGQYHQLFCLPLPLYLRLSRLEQQVRLDHLTGLGNRSYFDEAIGRAVEQHCREPHGLVLVLLARVIWGPYADHPDMQMLMGILAALFAAAGFYFWFVARWQAPLPKASAT